MVYAKVGPEVGEWWGMGYCRMGETLFPFLAQFISLWNNPAIELPTYTKAALHTGHYSSARTLARTLAPTSAHHARFAGRTKGNIIAYVGRQPFNSRFLVQHLVQLITSRAQGLQHVCNFASRSETFVIDTWRRVRNQGE